MYYDNDVIEHHGVLGMKWGVRHDKTSSGSSSKSSARAAKKAAAKAEKATRKVKATAARQNLSLGTRALATAGKVAGTIGGMRAGALAGGVVGSTVGSAGLAVAAALGTPVTAGVIGGAPILTTNAFLAYNAAIAGGAYSGAALGGVKVHSIVDKAVDNLLIQENDRVTKNSK
jgi:predicted lipid-binding transport protein (Tim44 family)